jgi:hypothetical protein
MTKAFLPAFCLLASLLVLQGQAFSSDISRRQALTKAIGTVAGGVVTTLTLPGLANAEISEETPRVVTRMGGLLVSNIEQSSRSLLPDTYEANVPSTFGWLILAS